MRAIVEQPREEIERLNGVQKHLKEVGLTRQNAFVDYQTTSGYAHYTFRGQQSSEVVEKLGRGLTSEEIIILADGGFSHFGATCTVGGTGFAGRVNTD